MELYKVTNSKFQSIFTTGKYKYSYNIGDIITALPWTFGIMLFNNIEQAKIFAHNHTMNGNILLVTNLSKIIEHFRVSTFMDEASLDNYYKKYKKELLVEDFNPNDPILCCQSIKIIKEII